MTMFATRAAAAVAILSLASCRGAERISEGRDGAESTSTPALLTARAEFSRGDGADIGTVTFTAVGDPAFAIQSGAQGDGPAAFGMSNAVIIEIALSGLPQGSYVMHVHDADRCELPNFKTMGKYLADGYSDSFTVAGDGTHRTNSLSNEFKLKPGQGSILSKALVIHAVSDREKFDPKSDSEAVVACGVIARQ